MYPRLTLTHYIAGNVLKFWILVPLPSMTPCPRFKVEDTSTETGKDFPAITQTAKANWVLFGESGLLFHVVLGSTSQNQFLSTFMSLCRCDWFSKGLLCVSMSISSGLLTHPAGTSLVSLCLLSLMKLFL